MKTIYTLIFAMFLIANNAFSQEKMYIYKGGAVLYSQSVNNIDSITFKEVINNNETVTDIDGNVYHTVTIGTQTWMVENLKTTKYRNGNGAVIPNVTVANSWLFLTTGAYCNYDNDEANGIKYGRLYNWYAVNDSRLLAPAGWHIATDAEWTILVNFLIANGYNYDGTTDDCRAAKSLASKTDWTSFSGPGVIGNDLTKNNSTGFNALPGGCRTGLYSTIYENIKRKCCWWTSDNNAISWHLEYNSSYVFRNSDYKNSGYYVRCVKDYE